jgi:hypothetical protein
MKSIKDKVNDQWDQVRNQVNTYAKNQIAIKVGNQIIDEFFAQNLFKIRFEIVHQIKNQVK